MLNKDLESTPFLEVHHPSTIEFCSDINPNQSEKEIALALYYKVRDYFLYDPFHLHLTHEALKSSSIFQKRRAWCVEKSIILVTCLRYFKIPSRLGYAIVINHIGSDKLVHYLKREEIVFHGYTEVFLDNKWIKCTPAFDKKVCRIANLTPLDWNGENDSLFQSFDHNRKFMQYIHEYGTFNDVPIELMNAEMKKYYPHLFENTFERKDFSFTHL